MLGSLIQLIIFKKYIHGSYCSLPTYSVGESEPIHFEEVYAWLFSVSLATSSVGDSELIDFPEAYAWLVSGLLATYSVGSLNQYIFKKYVHGSFLFF